MRYAITYSVIVKAFSQARLKFERTSDARLTNRVWPSRSSIGCEISEEPLSNDVGDSVWSASVVDESGEETWVALEICVEVWHSSVVSSIEFIWN